MRHYVLWGDVQERLIRYEKETGVKTYFPDALSLLWQEGAAHTASTLPSLSFSDWDGSSVSGFHTILDSMPIDITYFLNSAQGFSSPPDELRESLNMLPIKIAAHQKQQLHTHRNFEFLYVLQGHAYAKTPTETVSCPTGTFCLLAPEFVHDVIVEPNSEVISLAFWRESVQQILQKLLKHENMLSEFFQNSLNPSGTGYVLLQLPPDKRTKLLLMQIFTEGYSRASYALELCHDYIELLFTYALRTCSEPPDEHPQRGKKSAFPIVAVLKYIQDHYRTTSLSETAAKFHYDPDYLSRQLKASTGQGYGELTLQMKLEAAKQLLLNTKLSMEQIAEQVGFGSSVHFSRIFRTKYGIPPSRFRKQ